MTWRLVSPPLHHSCCSRPFPEPRSQGSAPAPGHFGECDQRSGTARSPRCGSVCKLASQNPEMPSERHPAQPRPAAVSSERDGLACGDDGGFRTPCPPLRGLQLLSRACRAGISADWLTVTITKTSMVLPVEGAQET